MNKREAFSVIAYVRRHSHHFKILIVLLSVIVPITMLYSLYPSSFDRTFNGRAYYIFFVWLVALGFILDWDRYSSNTTNSTAKRKLAFGLAATLPTFYVIASNFFGLNQSIMELFRPHGIVSPWLDNTPLAIEYLVLTSLFATIIFLAYKTRGLTDFSPSIALIGIFGAVTTINILYPYGQFTPFQILVPLTATLSEGVLNSMGYLTWLIPNKTNFTPTLYASNSVKVWGGQIAWPCAGVDSLLTYSIIILLFLKKAYIPRLHKAIYFVIGAAVTYFINVLRIVTLYLIGMNNGDVWLFHDYYGQLYSAIWIVSYPLIILGSQTIWIKLKSFNSKEEMVKIEPRRSRTEALEN